MSRIMRGEPSEQSDKFEEFSEDDLGFEDPLDEATSLLGGLHDDKPILLRHDSEFSVNTTYEYGSPNNLNMWQGVALLMADCLGTGLLALPADIHVLGYGLGLGFLVANLPINLYAGTIFHWTASAVEDRQRSENFIYRLSRSGGVFDATDDGAGVDYRAINQDTLNSVLSHVSVVSTNTTHTQLHHDTATHDYIGMTNSLFSSKSATAWVMCIYYVNIFLVLGNYILVMSHSVAAAVGEDRICLPTAGLLASVGMFVVSQSRTMARLGRAATVISLTSLFVVVMLCLYAARHPPLQNAVLLTKENTSSGEHSLLRKLSAMGSIGFAVGSQKLFLNIRHELADRSVAPYSLALALTLFGAFYIWIILMAGPDPPALLLDAIPTGTTGRRVAGLLLWMHVVVSYAINSQAICSSLDRLVMHRRMVDMAPASRWMALTFVMAVASFLVANAIPFFQDLVSLIGAITSVPLTLLLPGLFWRRHLQVPLWGITRDTCTSAALTYFSLCFMIAATAGSLYSIQQDWSRHGPPFSCH